MKFERDKKIEAYVTQEQWVENQRTFCEDDEVMDSKASVIASANLAFAYLRNAAKSYAFVISLMPKDEHELADLEGYIVSQLKVELAAARSAARSFHENVVKQN